jgi:hypothetical protein
VNSHHAHILLRREHLLARISAQRADLAGVTRRWERPLRIADTVIAAVRFLRAHPVLLAGLSGVVGVFAVRRGGLSGLTRMVWRAWGLYRSIASFSGRRHS